MSTPAPAQDASLRGRYLFSLSGKLALVLVLTSVTSIAATLILQHWLHNAWLSAICATLLVIVLALVLSQKFLSSYLSMLRALGGTVSSYRDGDFAFGLHWRGRDEFGDLVVAHNRLGDALRDQRLRLTQRELLLDTMVQNTPVAMVLLNETEHVIYSNLAARKLLNSGHKLEGLTLPHLLESAPPTMAEAFARGGDGLFPVHASAQGIEDGEQVWHLARRRFRLNGKPQQLLLLRQLTSELRRQEVQVWKNVLRVISHELNNSLAPIASLAHSGAELLRRGDHVRLDIVFSTIAERARHLEGFISGYAQFAKLPMPRLEDVMLAQFLLRLHSQAAFRLEGETNGQTARIDPAQMEQALLNLLRNARESGSPENEVRLRLRSIPNHMRIDVLDRGPGMSDTVLKNALLPFYSTKHNGTGLGLALTREIVEAHGGHIALANRDGGGLAVILTLPA